MQGFGTDRALSAQEWRVLLLTACGVLIVGVGLGVLIGRIIAISAEPPPVSASILPDASPSPDATAVPVPSNDGNTVAPPPPAVPPPVVLKAAAPPAPVEQNAPPAERAATPPRVEARRRPEHPAPARRATAAPAARPITAAPAARSITAAPAARSITAAPAARSITAAPAARPAPAESPAGGRRWAVQLGAFQSSDHANLLVNTLAAHGQAAHVTFARNAAGQSWFYVQTPPFQTAAAARSAAKSLGAREHLPTYLVKLPEPGP